MAASAILYGASASALAWLRGDARELTDVEVSRTISVARISLIVGLVFLHYGSYPNSRISPFVGIDTQAHQLATGVNSFVLFSFFSVVPLLSMISGWLFFSFTAEKARTAIASRIRKRFTSLYLPLVFWNALFLVILLALFTASPSHSLLGAINIDFAEATWRQYINAVFALTQHPIGFQFWFVRDLFVCALMSPILWFFLRRAAGIAAVVLGACWLADIDLVIFFRPDVVFFFFLGGLVRQQGAALHVGLGACIVFCALYVLLIGLRSLAPYVIDLTNPAHDYLVEVATRATRLIGVLACWSIIQRFALTGMGEVVGRFGSFAFFLHAAHYPLLAAIKLSLWPLLPAQTDGWMLAHYAASVIATVAIGICAGLLLARLFPRAFALMNGGRAALGDARAPSRSSARPVKEVTKEVSSTPQAP